MRKLVIALLLLFPAPVVAQSVVEADMSVTTTENGTETASLTLVTAGNTIVAGCTESDTLDASAFPTISDSQSNNYVKVIEECRNTDELCIHVWYVPYAAAGATTVTCTWGATVTGQEGAFAVELNHPSGTLVLDVETSSFGTSTTPYPGSVTTTVANGMGVLVSSAGSAVSTWNAPSGFTLQSTSTTYAGGLATNPDIGAIAAEAPYFSGVSSVAHATAFLAFNLWAPGDFAGSFYQAAPMNQINGIDLADPDFRDADQDNGDGTWTDSSFNIWTENGTITWISGVSTAVDITHPLKPDHPRRGRKRPMKPEDKK